MGYFHFERLIEKYISDFTAIVLSEGHYDTDTGDYIKGEKKIIPMQGAIISFKESKVFRSEGTLTEKDKRLFVLEPIGAELQTSEVVYKDDLYKIQECTENAQFTDVYAYTLKYVSAFKKAYPGYDITKELGDLEKRLDGVLIFTQPETPDNGFADSMDKLGKRLDGVEND